MEKQERLDLIHEKGFDMIRGSSDESPYNNYARIKIGNKAYDSYPKDGEYAWEGSALETYLNGTTTNDYYYNLSTTAQNMIKSNSHYYWWNR